MPKEKNNAAVSKKGVEVSDEVDFSRGLVFRGAKSWRDYLKWKRGYAKLDPELRKIFPNDRDVNDVLRHAAEIAKAMTASKRTKKTA